MSAPLPGCKSRSRRHPLHSQSTLAVSPQSWGRTSLIQQLKCSCGAAQIGSVYTADSHSVGVGFVFAHGQEV